MSQPKGWRSESRPFLAGAGHGWHRSWGQGLRLALALVLVLTGMLPTPWLQPQAAWAGPVEWQEVPASAAGRQWWDRGSLRLSKEGTLTVLSRFQPASSEPALAEAGAERPPTTAGLPPTTARPPATAQGQEQAQAPDTDQETAKAQTRRPRQASSELYVSEIDCDQNLMRDTSINGIPQWRASWQPVADDGLMQAVVQSVCEAGSQLLASR